VQNSQKGGPHSTSKQGGPRRPPHSPPLISLPEYYMCTELKKKILAALGLASVH